MLEIDVQGDETLQYAFNRMLSGLLPHEKYESQLFSEILLKINQLFDPSELYGEYCVLLKILNEFKKIGNVFSGYDYRVSKDSVGAVLEANITDLVRNPDVKIEVTLNQAGLETNINIESVFMDACNFLYSKVMDLYDECFTLRISSTEALSYFPALKAAFVKNVAQQSLITQANILRDTAFINRKVYRGPDDWMRYISEIRTILDRRLEDDADGIIRINDSDSGFQLLQNCYGMFEPLADYDIPPLDDGTPMMRHRLVLLAANENVGKTSVAINLVNNLILKGKKVLYMCGETTSDKIYSILLVNYIYKRHGICIDRKSITRPDTLADEHRRIVNVANAEYANLGCLRLKQSFNYDTFYEELASEYNKEPFDAVFIDHSRTLKGKGEMYDKLGKLAVQARDFKREFPVYLCILSHLSTYAKKALSGGKNVDTSTARGNSTLDTEADDVLVLTSNETLEARGELMVLNTKRRDAAKVTSPMILHKKFEVSSYFYDASVQDNDSELAEIDSLYSFDSDDDEYSLMLD